MKKKRNHKIKSDFGINDYFSFYIDNYNIIKDKSEYRSILKEFNDSLIDLIIEETVTYKLPYVGFEITIRKDKRLPKIKNGKLVNNRPPNWAETKKLWDQDKEAKEKKIIIRHDNTHTSGYVFRVYCKKFKSNLRYKNLYRFKANRNFTRKLSERLLDKEKDNLNSFLLY